MATIPSAFHDLFEKRTFAHVTTLNPDGDPHTTPVWIDYDADDDRILVNTERGRRKERNVAANPRVSVSLLDPDDPYRYLSVTGEVTATTTEGAKEHIETLSKRYTGAAEYPGTIQTERIILRIRPDEVLRSGDG